jgi:hypothetical protein
MRPGVGLRAVGPTYVNLTSAEIVAGASLGIEPSTGGNRPRVCKNKIPTSQISILMILDHRCCAESKHNRLIGLVLHGKCNCREFLHTLGQERALRLLTRTS